MPQLRFVASLCPDQDTRSTAFCTPFNIADIQTRPECSVSVNEKKHIEGCSVSRMDISIHSSSPHLESAAHVLGKEYFPYNLTDVFPQGTMEECFLITPQIVKLADSNDSYPVGSPDDEVICRRELMACMDPLFLAKDVKVDSVLIRIQDAFLPRYSGSLEIRDWPYLTLEAVEYLRHRVAHYRTNAPSIERCVSGGGMWSHCAFFGLDIDRRRVESDIIHRTIGELFYIPEGLNDGQYILICPYFDVGIDCAITSPLLFSTGA